MKFYQVAITTLIVSAAIGFFGGTGWLLSQKGPAPISITAPAAVTVVTDKEPQISPDPKDIPGQDDEFISIGITAQGIIMLVDKTRGTYDPKTHKSEFLMLYTMAEGKEAIDANQRKFDLLINRVSINCLEHSIRIISTIEAGGPNEDVIDYAVFPEKWTVFPIGKKTITETLYTLTCPIAAGKTVRL
jgi:hypothetical protein